METKWSLNETRIHQNQVQIEGLTALVRGDLTDLQRFVIVALITTDVHARDIIDELRERDVEGPHDFLWQQQLPVLNRPMWPAFSSGCVRHVPTTTSHRHHRT